MTHEEAMALLVRAGAEYVYEDTRKAIAAEIIAAVEAQRQKDAALARARALEHQDEQRRTKYSENFAHSVAEEAATAIADAIEAQK